MHPSAELHLMQVGPQLSTTAEQGSQPILAFNLFAMHQPYHPEHTPCTRLVPAFDFRRSSYHTVTVVQPQVNSGIFRNFETEVEARASVPGTTIISCCGHGKDLIECSRVNVSCAVDRRQHERRRSTREVT